MAQKQAKATAAISKHKEMKEQQLREEDERHRATVEALTANYDHFVAVEQAALTKCDEDAEKQRLLVEAALGVVSKQMKDNFPASKTTKKR